MLASTMRYMADLNSSASATQDQHVVFNAELIQRYDHTGPRYTSYPTAVEFDQVFTEAHYRRHAKASNQSGRPLSLYFHLPFCATVCYYCACNKIVTANRGRAVTYLDYLHREIELQGTLFHRDRSVDQLHWGGGTPTFLSNDQIVELMRHTARHFHLRDDDQGEYSIEIDPREVASDTIRLLRGLGFNRISLGVQDFDPEVQVAVNRIQSATQTYAVMEAARDADFRSVNVDLIYGLPLQTHHSFAKTLDRVIEMDPDRLSVFNYAHLPQRFKVQRRINAVELPTAQEKLATLQVTIERLTAAGYVYIGMDHFAKPDDELAIAQRQRKLYRNFQGYSTHADCDLVGMGITAISHIGNSFSQNVRTLERYYERIENGELPILRGIELDEDDLVRQVVINELICNGFLDVHAVEQRFRIDFPEYFTSSLPALHAMQAAGLVSVTDAAILVQPQGRLLIRNVCMAFDNYLQREHAQSFSKLI